MSGWRQYLPLTDEELLAQCDFDRFRASGPGGQKRNRTDSGVRLRHRPSGLQAEAVESRSQHDNRARALRRLRVTIALALRAPTAESTTNEAEALRTLLAVPPSRLRPADLSALAVLFDTLEEHGWRISAASAAIGVNTASVSRMLRIDARLWRATAERRAALGLSMLRTDR